MWFFKRFKHVLMVARSGRSAGQFWYVGRVAIIGITLEPGVRSAFCRARFDGNRGFFGRRCD